MSSVLLISSDFILVYSCFCGFVLIPTVTVYLSSSWDMSGFNLEVLTRLHSGETLRDLNGWHEDVVQLLFSNKSIPFTYMYCHHRIPLYLCLALISQHTSLHQKCACIVWISYVSAQQVLMAFSFSKTRREFDIYVIISRGGYFVTNGCNTGFHVFIFFSKMPPPVVKRHAETGRR